MYKEERMNERKLKDVGKRLAVKMFGEGKGWMAVTVEGGKVKVEVSRGQAYVGVEKVELKEEEVEWLVEVLGEVVT